MASAPPKRSPVTGGNSPADDRTAELTKAKTSQTAISDPSTAVEGSDIAVAVAVTKDRQGLNILRRRNEQIEAATVRPLESGKPIHGEIVTLTPRAESPAIMDVETQYAPPETRISSEGRPAQIATDTYRKNWDTIWSRRSSNKQLN
ncbi:MAG: hypothetical protein HRU17_00720 [Polyangiaceae bacterium]|nr:hypothetical protein [Polyangiaceae bacterium]